MIFSKYQKKRALDYIEALWDSDKRVKITDVKEIRTISQNRLYWLYMNCLEDYTGQDKKELHTYFKYEYIESSTREIFGKTITLEPSTSQLNTKQFTEYIDKIVRFAATTLSVVLPSPSDLGYNEFVEFYKDRL